MSIQAKTGASKAVEVLKRSNNLKGSVATILWLFVSGEPQTKHSASWFMFTNAANVNDSTGP